jgi:hypothetical protein
MLEALERMAIDVSALHNKLILLVGPPGGGKSALLLAFGKSAGVESLNVGAVLGRRLAAMPHKQRHLQAGTELRELADEYAKGDLLLLDNIELLFDTSLQINPLELLKRHAHSKRVVAVWPGELRQGRLTYAHMGHSEYRDYAADGLVILEMQ